MLTDAQEQVIEEISKELKLLTKAILEKLGGVCNENYVTIEEDKVAKIFCQDNLIKFSLLIPKAFEARAFSASLGNRNISKYVRSVLNSTLSAIRKELTDVVSYRFVESNLRYTGFSISPFGFTLEIPMARLVSVKIRKITVEIVASLSLDELKSHALCSTEANTNLPSDLIFAALRRRRDIAKTLTMPHSEYDIDEIEEQLDSVIKELQKNFHKDALIAS